MSGKYSIFHALEWACMYHNYHSRSSPMIRALWPPGKLLVLFTGKLHKKVRKVRRWNVIDSEILWCLSWFDWLILWFLSWFDWLILDVFVITDCNLVSDKYILVHSYFLFSVHLVLVRALIVALCWFPFTLCWYCYCSLYLDHLDSTYRLTNAIFVRFNGILSRGRCVQPYQCQI